MKRAMLLMLLLAFAYLTGVVSAQTPEPTQTPYIIYVVVTATPTPEQTPVPETIQIVQDDAPVITRPHAAEDISLVNGGNGTSGNEGGNVITIANQTGGSSSYASSVDELVQLVVATVMADTSTAAGGAQLSGGTGGALVHQSDGSTCTMNFQLLSEPTYPAGAIIPRGEVFWKEWLIQNTGTCTWTPDWEFVFDSGWQIGNTRFHMNRTTAPGQTLNVRLAMVPDQKQDGNYYSTYAFEAPDGTRYGTITSSYTVKPASYFAKPTEKVCDRCKPQHGRPAGHECWPYPAPYCWPWW